MDISKVLEIDRYSSNVISVCHEVFGRYEEIKKSILRPTEYIPIVNRGLFSAKSVLEISGNSIFLVVGSDYAYDIVNRFPYLYFVPIKNVVSGDVPTFNVVSVEVGYRHSLTKFNIARNYPVEVVCISSFGMTSYSNLNKVSIKVLLEDVKSYLDSIPYRIYEDPTYPGRDVYSSALDLLDRSVFNSVMNDEGEPEEFNYDTCSDYYLEYLPTGRRHSIKDGVYPPLYRIKKDVPKISNFSIRIANYIDGIKDSFSNSAKNDIRSHVRQKLEEESRLEEIVDNPDT